MRKVACTIIFAAALAPMFAPPAARAQGLIRPIVHPSETTGLAMPVFIWQDMYIADDAKKGIRHRLTIRDRNRTDATPVALIMNPEIYYRQYYAFRLPSPLSPGRYEYTIERMSGASSLTTRHYHYARYPIQREFELSSEKTDLDGLPPGYLIPWLHTDRDNRLQNGYNSLFFAGGAAISFGMGLLFYSVIDLGVISTVIYVLAFTSSATGITASAYYGCRYFATKRKLARIMDLGKNAALNGGVLDDTVMSEIEFRY
ncbi:MAG TPA: hypothetical protein VLM75_12370 [Spirochaetota bacterium]|nr:hypothetical protein [Spirochaetota bacterium]